MLNGSGALFRVGVLCRGRAVASAADSPRAHPGSWLPGSIQPGSALDPTPGPGPDRVHAARADVAEAPAVWRLLSPLRPRSCSGWFPHAAAVTTWTSTLPGSTSAGTGAVRTASVGLSKPMRRRGRGGRGRGRGRCGRPCGRGCRRSGHPAVRSRRRGSRCRRRYGWGRRGQPASRARTTERMTGRPPSAYLPAT